VAQNKYEVYEKLVSSWQSNEFLKCLLVVLTSRGPAVCVAIQKERTPNRERFRKNSEIQVGVKMTNLKLTFVE
jgi:hypothetical protein